MPPMQPEPAFSNVLIDVLSRALERKGVDPSPLYLEREQSRSSSTQISWLSLAQIEALFARAIQLSGDTAFGLQVAADATESSFGLLAHLIMHAPTLRAALQVCSRFNSLVIDDGYMFLSERGTTARLRCEFSRGAAFSTTYAEFALSGLMRMLLEFGAARTQVSAVYFEHVRPAHYAAYARVFGERVVHFEHSFTGIDFAREILDRPRMLHHAELYQLFEAQAVRSLELLPQPRSLLDQLEKYLAAHPMARIPDLMQAARDLNTSTRSLRRQLAREGVSYRDVMQGARQRGAVRLLHDPKRTLQEIANELGFADASSFNRAFKRWTGRTPGQYRAGMAASSCGADAVITPTPMSRARKWTAEG